MAKGRSPFSMAPPPWGMLLSPQMKRLWLPLAVSAVNMARFASSHPGMSPSLDEKNTRSGLMGAFMTVMGYMSPPFPPMFLKVPLLVSTLWKWSGLNHAIEKAAMPPELLPVAARPAGSSVML